MTRELTLAERWALQRRKEDEQHAEVIKQAYREGADPIEQMYLTTARAIRYGTDEKQHTYLDELGIPREADLMTLDERIYWYGKHTESKAAGQEVEPKIIYDLESLKKHFGNHIPAERFTEEEVHKWCDLHGVPR